MKDYVLAGRQAELEAQRDAQLVRIDRYLQNLENFARQRIEHDLPALADRLNLKILTGIVADLQDAVKQYQTAQAELQRL